MTPDSDIIITHPLLSEAKTHAIIRMLLCFMPLLGMGIDLIAPSLPAISHSVHISPMIAKDLVAIFLVGGAIGTFLSGTLSDTWGRRRFILSGFILLTLASLLPLLWSYPFVLLLSRFLQGLAAGSFSVLLRSVAADLLTGPALLRTASWMATMWGIGPIIGPIIGGYLQVYFGWQANFLFFAAYGLAGIIACSIWLPETHHKRRALSLKRIKNNFATLLPHKIFVSLSVLMGCFYAVLIIFNTLGPFSIEKNLGYSPIFFGQAAFCLGIIFLCGTFCCRALIKYFDPQKILSVTVPIVLVFCLIDILVSYSIHNVWTVLVPTAFLFFSTGIVYPTCMGATMSMFKELAGSAAAIATLINLAVTASSGFFSSLISNQSVTAIAFTSAAFVFVGFSLYSWAIRAAEPVQAIKEINRRKVRYSE